MEYERSEVTEAREQCPGEKVEVVESESGHQKRRTVK
jgi:hypothetical protein